ncbi:MAG TPA: hypothetical protein VF624_07495 [Tepidisphaeraceae bacterium]|jgi:hypothetical protein
MRFSTSLLIGLCLSGCAAGPQRPASAPPPPAKGVPVALQLQRRDDSLQGGRFRTLLNFETAEDTSFVRGRRVTSAGAAAHTGKSAVEVEGNEADVAVDSLLFGTRLPGEWTLLGAYVYPPVDSSITAELVDGDRAIGVTRRCAAGQWNLLALDLTSPEAARLLASATAPRLRLRWDERAAAVRIDDVLLIDNTRALVEPPPASAGWSVRRRGYVTRLDSPGRFSVSVTAAAADERGWVVDEIGPARAVLRSAGDVRDWIIYPDGHAYRDGRFEPLTRMSEDARRCHLAPADVSVDDAGGRVDRTSPGDVNNDGYNERRGAYQIQAAAPRLQVTLAPQGAPVLSPVIEVDGLAAGAVQVMVEGRVFDDVARLPGGRVLIGLPLRIEKPTVIAIKVVSDNAAARSAGGASDQRRGTDVKYDAR